MMSSESPQADRISRSFYLLPALFSAVVTALAVMVWMFQADARRQIEDLSTANSDSTQWFLAQAEVEIMALQRAVTLLQLDPLSPARAQDVRQRFDIFYSRLQTLRVGRSFAPLRDAPGVAVALGDLVAILDAAIPAIDGTDRQLGTQLAAIAPRLDIAVPLTRHVSLEGVRIFTQGAELRRQGVAKALYDLSLLVIPLFVVLVVATLVLFGMFRSAYLQNQRIAAAGLRMRALFEASIDAILVARPDGRIRGYNQAAERIYGHDPEDVMGEDVVEMLTPADQREAVRALLDQVRSGRPRPAHGGPDIIQTTARHKSGRIIPIELSLSVTADARGPLLVAFVRDVSRRVAEEAELIDARDRAVAGEKAKAKMVAVMSHEMRTPLNGILGTLELLKPTVLDERQHHYLKAMEHSARMLLQHVNDVLDASRANSDKVTFSTGPVDLRALVVATTDGLRAQAEAQGNRLVVEFQGDHDRALIGDALRLKQIVVNLVGNAIKFTENGRIDVELDRSAGGGHVELRVTDTGVGIAETDIERVFDEFVTLGPTFDRKVQGTGLGLSIVKGLVEAMGGDIDVVSEIGRGTVFCVSLTLPEASPQDAPVERKIPGVQVRPGLEVLVVEDNEINRMVVGEMLRRHGCRVSEAVDGVVSVEMASRDTYDLILMDISMPRLNGVDAARQIRMQGPNRSSPIVALTAHAMPEDLDRFQAAGMDRVLIKPLQLPQLVAVLHDCRPQAGIPLATTDLVATLGAAPAKVLMTRIFDEMRVELPRLLESGVDVAALSHRLAGSAAIGGLHELHQSLIAIEKDMRTGDRKLELAGEVGRLLRMLDKFAA